MKQFNYLEGRSTIGDKLKLFQQPKVRKYSNRHIKQGDILNFISKAGFLSHQIFFSTQIDPDFAYFKFLVLFMCIRMFLMVYKVYKGKNIKFFNNSKLKFHNFFNCA